MNIVLLDRDGTLIVAPPDERVDSVEKVVLFPDTIEALKYLADNNFSAVIITNQAGIAEGRFSEKEFWAIHEVLLNKIAPSGIKILKTYMDDHGTDEVNEFRKPGPGMLLAAASEFEINLKDTYMVGDRITDVQAGINAGSKTILVKNANPTISDPDADYTAVNLLDAVTYLVAH